MKTICIMCPIGCEMEVKKAADGYQVTGNACIRGKDYGIKECTKPERMITTIVRLPDDSGTVSLKTQRSVDKNLIKDILLEIKKQKVSFKLKSGDVFIKNVLDTGVDIVVTCINQETI